MSLLFIDHVAITVADMEATAAFYTRLFGAEVLMSHAQPNGQPMVRSLRVGGGVQLNLHQEGNGVALVAAKPTPGSVDICFRWGGPIESAIALLRSHGLEIVNGPSPRKDNNGRPAQSVYFHDPDRNLVELMSTDA